MIAVRRVTIVDGALLKDVRLAALLDTPSAFGSTYAAEAAMDDAAWAARAEASASGDERVTYFAVDDDRVIGLVGGWRPDEPGASVELISMWTAPDARRRGVGRMLVHAVLDWADASVALWVTGGNDPARLLYESMGFEVTGLVQPHPSDPCKNEVRMIRLG